MPVLLFLLGAATVALVASHAHAKTPKPAPTPPSPYTFDPYIDATTRAMVETALARETDPARLEAFATEVGARFPYAAWYLRQKAAGLRRMGYGAPLSLPPLPKPQGDGLDAHLPDNLRFNVVELLTMGTDPAQLEAFAGQLSAYPLASAALRLRAAYLRSLGAGANRAAPSPAVVTPPVQAPAPGAPVQAPAPPVIASPMPAPTVPAPVAEPPSIALPTPVPTAPPASPPTAPPSVSLPQVPLPGFDPGMPPEVAMQVATALLTETDPAKLRALGNALLPSYPTAATMLFGKANTLSPTPPPVPVPTIPTAEIPFPVPVLPAPLPPASSDAAQPAASAPAAPSMPSVLDAGMPPDEQARVAQALHSETDPARLRAYADSLASRYPKAAVLLSSKAEALQLLHGTRTPPSVRTYRVKDGDFPIKIAKKFGQPESAWRDLIVANPHKPKAPDGNFKQLLPGEDLILPASWPDMGSQRPTEAVPSSGPAASKTSFPADPPALPAPSSANGPTFDPRLPPNIAQAVATALTTETDPTKLRGFASSIQAHYPLAAAALLAKANSLSVLSNTTPSVPLALPAGTSSTGPHQYKVQKGDSPSRIAKKLVGDDRRWRELVAANPKKAKSPDGNFKNLQPGEVLDVPASWASLPSPIGVSV